jgi:hypothetical protein
MSIAPFWNCSAAYDRPLLTDAVEKVGGTLTGRYNRIKTGRILNRYCAFGSSLESMLLGKAAKILFRQHRSKADDRKRLNSSRKVRSTLGREPPEPRRPWCRADANPGPALACYGSFEPISVSARLSISCLRREGAGSICGRTALAFGESVMAAWGEYGVEHHPAPLSAQYDQIPVV